MGRQHPTQRQSNGHSSTRRGFLKASVATGLAVGGVAVGAGGAAAAIDVPYVSTRGHFDISWGDVYITDGHTKWDYDVVGDVPGLDVAGGDELVVHVHGWLNDETSANEGFGKSKTALRNNGYDQPFVGYSWDSDTSVFEWWDATEVAERNGLKLANFLYHYHRGASGTDVRLIAHSLGARVVLSAIDVLHRSGLDDVVTSLSLLGGAADNDAVALDGAYGPALGAATGQTDNFWQSDDQVLSWAYSVAEWDGAVGEDGAEGTPPANYEDHNVEYVPDHFSYYEPDEGCMAEVVAEF